ncbi:MAG: guanylate kinase [Planctomycetota bacterium]|nr:MAG: guanylate kinase [Planctomycetota bacterium]
MPTTTQPPERHAAPNRGLLVVISGPSGVGKTTITKRVQEAIPDAVFAVSATTRPKAPGERDGVDYHFLRENEFEQLVQEGAFLEHARYAGHRYGTLKREVTPRLEQGRVVLLDIDVQGAQQIKQQAPQALAIFILPPDEQTLLERLRRRGRDPEAVIQRRFREAQREIAFARSAGVYDVMIVNDDLDQAVANAVQAIQARRTSAA